MRSLLGPFLIAPILDLKTDIQYFSLQLLFVSYQIQAGVMECL